MRMEFLKGLVDKDPVPKHLLKAQESIAKHDMFSNLILGNPQSIG